MCSVLQSTSGPLKNGENSVQIHSYAIVPQTGTKLIKNAVLNLVLCCGTILRHREKLQYMCTTTIHLVYKCSKKILKNLLPVGLLVCTNLFIPSHFWTTDMKFDTCCQHYVATCGKNLYRCTSTVSALKNYSRSFFKTLSYIRSGVHKLFRRFFFYFRNF